MTLTPHQILNVNPNASGQQLRKAWLKAVRRHYVGAKHGDRLSQTQMRMVNNAYVEVKRGPNSPANGPTMSSLFMAGLETPKGQAMLEDLFKLDDQAEKQKIMQSNRMNNTVKATVATMAAVCAAYIVGPRLSAAAAMVLSVVQLCCFAAWAMGRQKANGIANQSEERWQGIWEAGKEKMVNDIPASDPPARAAISQLVYNRQAV